MWESSRTFNLAKRFDSNKGILWVFLNLSRIKVVYNLKYGLRNVSKLSRSCEGVYNLLTDGSKEMTSLMSLPLLCNPISKL